MRAANRGVCVRSVGRKLTADEFGDVDAIPVTLAEQRVGTRHRLYAAPQCLNVVVERTAAMAHVLGDGSNARQQIFDAMIQRGDEQALLVRGSLACGDVESEALEAYKSPQCIEFGLCCFLEPDFPAVGALEAEGGGIARAFGGNAAHQRLEPLAVVRVHPREKIDRGKGLPRIEPEDLRGVGAALRRTRADVPYERRDRPCRERLLQAGFALREGSFVLPPLSE